MNIEKFTADVRAFEKNIKINSGYLALSDLKTLDKLLSQAKQMLKENDKISNTYNKAYDNWGTIDKKRSAAEKSMKGAEKSYDSNKKSMERTLATLQKTRIAASEEYSKLSQQQDEAYTKYTQAQNQLKTQQQANKSFEDRFKQQIDSFKMAAKALGVKVDVKEIYICS